MPGQLQFEKSRSEHARLRFAGVADTMRNDQGFTLIELLVVIAIIGLLSAIVLASLNTARSKGSDAAVQSDLDSERTQAELVRDTYNCYAGSTGSCTAESLGSCANGGGGTTSQMFGTNGAVTAITKAAVNAGGGLSACSVGAGAQSYVLIVQLKTDLATAWCIDGTGASKKEGTPGGTTLTQTTLQSFVTSGQCS